MRGSMPPKYVVREVLKTLEMAELESKLPIYDDGRMIVEEGHLALKDEMKFGTRKSRRQRKTSIVEQIHEQRIQPWHYM